MSKKSNHRINKKELLNRLLCLFEQSQGRTLNIKDIFRTIGAQTHPAKMLTIEVLEDLVFDDYLTSDQQGNYCHQPRSIQVIEGIFHKKRNGHNVFSPDDGGKEILVGERNSLHALDGDRVKVTMLARRRGHAREAEVIEIVERAKDTFVGKIQVERDYAFVLTDRSLATDIFVPRANIKGAKNGEKVLVKIVDWPEQSKCPTGKVVDILGAEGDNDTEMHAILAEYGLPYTYPSKVEKAAEKIQPGISAEEIARREDFRDVTTFTIDPHDAKDFDDALSIRILATPPSPRTGGADSSANKKNSGDAQTVPPVRGAKGGVFEVGVHIADVSHYVEEGSIIDREALDRATSVYLVDRTIPMLPEHLCNFVCSLRPDEEKLTFSVIFTMNERAEVIDRRIAKTVIRSNRRFTYEEAQELIERNGCASADDLALPGQHPAVDGSYENPSGEWAQEILILDRLAKALRAKRFQAGAIGFDRPEVRFDVDEKGHPISTYVKVQKDANKLVEEFMLLANRAVAESVAKVPRSKTPKVLPYRVHDVPDPEKMERLRGFVAKFGYKVKTEGTKTEVSKSLNKLLADVKGHKEEAVVEMVALRAMMKARYSVHNIGHYGLMFQHYTHFTSPIRRYPDLMVHRLIYKYMEGGRSVSAKKYEDLCEHCSQREQLASTAERASIKYKQVEYMADRIGQEFDGTISGVTEFGLYVEDTVSKCEGMVPLRNLTGDYYEFDEDNYRLVGRRHHHVYNLGDRVRYRVDRANLERRQLDFGLIEDDALPAVTAHEVERARKAAKQAKKAVGRTDKGGKGKKAKKDKRRW